METSLRVKIDGAAARADARGLDSDLDRLTATGNRASGAFDRLKSGLTTAKRSIVDFGSGVKQAGEHFAGAFDRMTSGVNTFKAAVATLGAVVLTKQVVEIADSYQLMAGRLRLVTENTAQLVYVQQQLFEIAQATRNPMRETVDLYIRLAQSGRDLGATQAELLQFTRAAGNAITISGSSSQAAAGALTQLAQALAGTNVQAEEFNSIVDGAPEILRAVARNIEGAEGSIGKLRQMVLAGKVSSRDFFQAFLQDSENLERKVGSIPLTVGGAFQRLVNEINNSAGRADMSPLIATIEGLRVKIADPAFQQSLINGATAVATIASAVGKAAGAFVSLAQGIGVAIARIEVFFERYGRLPASTAQLAQVMKTPLPFETEVGAQPPLALPSPMTAPAGNPAAIGLIKPSGDGVKSDKPKSDRVYWQGFDLFRDALKTEDQRIGQEWTANAETILRDAMEAEERGRQLAEEARRFSERMAPSRRDSVRDIRDSRSLGEVNSSESAANKQNDSWKDSQITEFKRLEGSMTDSTQTLADIWKQYEDQRTEITRSAQAARLQIETSQLNAVGSIFGQMADIAATFGKRGFEAFKAAKIAEALITLPSTIMSAYESAIKTPVIGPVIAPVAAGLAGAFQMAQIQQIQSARYASGGLVTGPGSGTSDSIPARLSNGEYVIRESIVNQFGRGFFERLNGGGFAGLVTGEYDAPPIVSNTPIERMKSRAPRISMCLA